MYGDSKSLLSFPVRLIVLRDFFFFLSYGRGVCKTLYAMMFVGIKLHYSAAAAAVAGVQVADTLISSIFTTFHTFISPRDRYPIKTARKLQLCCRFEVVYRDLRSRKGIFRKNRKTRLQITLRCRGLIATDDEIFHIDHSHSRSCIYFLFL